MCRGIVVTVVVVLLSAAPGGFRRKLANFCVTEVEIVVDGKKDRSLNVLRKDLQV